MKITQESNISKAMLVTLSKQQSNKLVAQKSEALLVKKDKPNKESP